MKYDPVKVPLDSVEVERNTRNECINEIRSHILREASTIDVAPVRHGRWIDKGEYAVCTKCGGRSGTQYDSVEPIPLMTQFCPNCGAKMDEQQKGE